ncbi:hypothetical protein [Brucella pituitosa]|uniref:hypothetical protein n=1 Tax=Brucella pituitosa TaxID=571256 RepID=UPI003F4ADF36
MRNYAKKKSSSKLYGNPCVNKGYISFGANSYLQTDAHETNEMTIFSVIRYQGGFPVDGDGPIFYSNRDIGASGCGLFIRQASSQLWHTGSHFLDDQKSRQTGMPAYLQLADINMASWSLIVGRVELKTNELFNFTSNNRFLSKSNDNDRSPSPKTFRIGNDYSSTPSSLSVDIAMWALYSRALYDDEILQNVELIRNYMRPLDINV